MLSIELNVLGMSCGIDNCTVCTDDRGGELSGDESDATSGEGDDDNGGKDGEHAGATRGKQRGRLWHGDAVAHSNAAANNANDADDDDDGGGRWSHDMFAKDDDAKSIGFSSVCMTMGL
jgi:hypothetical protein